MTDFLPYVLSQVGRLMEEDSSAVLQAWPDIIGATLAPMTQAVSYTEGVLTVRVKNSTLYSLLYQRDKPHLLRALKKRFPQVTQLKFRM